jgi:hypothetical protein
MNEDIKYEVLWLNKNNVFKNAIFFDRDIALDFYVEKLKMGTKPQIKQHVTVTTILQCAVNKISHE